MVVTLVLLTLAVSITIEILRNRRASVRAASRAGTAPAATRVLERWFHPGHAWALVGDHSDLVEVGTDDFTQRFVGKVDRVELPERGARLEQGQKLLTLHHGGRSLDLVAPVSGVLVEVNRKLESHPEMLNEAPYGRGWVAKMAPIRLLKEISTMRRGAAADRWLESVQAQVAQWFSPRVGLVLQDGGQWVSDLGAALDDGEWRELAARLFPQAQEQPPNN